MQIPAFSALDPGVMEPYFPHADWLVAVDTSISEPEAPSWHYNVPVLREFSLREYRRKHTVTVHYRTPDVGRMLTISSDFQQLHPEPGHSLVCQVDSRIYFDRHENREIQYIVRGRDWREIVRYSMEMCWHQLGDPAPGWTGPASPAPHRRPEPPPSEPTAPPPEPSAARRRHLIRKRIPQENIEPCPNPG